MLAASRVQIKNTQNFFWSGWGKRWVHIKRSELYEKCYRILGVENSADQNTVRRAYIELVKRVHPDSRLPEASADRFQEIDEAFKVLQEKFAKNRRGLYDDEEEKVFDIEHTAPQHRQYLSFDGVGSGNQFQRQKQYQQIKAIKAQERVLNHRIQKSLTGEQTLIKKGGTYFKSHAIKTKYGFDRVVEDLIQEAISKGDFNNLSGKGKPLSDVQTQNPYLDFTTHKLNKILLENGFTPEWITMQRDIREAVKELRDSLVAERAFFGDYPFVAEEAEKWQTLIMQFQSDIERINKNIDKYNLIVPILQKQLFRLNLESISQEILMDPNLPRNFKPHNQTDPPSETKLKSKDFLSFIGSFF